MNEGKALKVRNVLHKSDKLNLVIKSRALFLKDSSTSVFRLYFIFWKVVFRMTLEYDLIFCDIYFYEQSVYVLSFLKVIFWNTFSLDISRKSNIGFLDYRIQVKIIFLIKNSNDVLTYNLLF